MSEAAPEPATSQPPAPRRRLRLAVFGVITLAAIATLGLLAQRFALQADWTFNGRNTLREASIAIVERIDTPLRIRAFVSHDRLRRGAIRQLVARYQRHSGHITLELIDFTAEPKLSRELGVSVDGELVLSYGERRANVRQLTEAALSTELVRLVAPQREWIAWTTGSGERDLLGDAPHDLGRLGARLRERGYRLAAMTLAGSEDIPDNVGVLLLSEGDSTPAPSVVAAIQRYIDRGGHLLWLGEPASRLADSAFARQLGVHLDVGTIVARQGPRADAMLTLSAFASHELVTDFKGPLVLAHSAGIAWTAPPGWRYTGVMASQLDSWSERDAADANPVFESDRDAPGPFDLAVAMQREDPAGGDEQRLLVFGDGDWLSNAFIGSGRNLDLALRAFAWLSNESGPLRLPAITPRDARFDPSTRARLLTGILPTIALPALLASIGVGRWLWRRRR